ncbi:MAG: hypothetical protein GDA42_04485 [Ekhidna sp.]|nr:hypothetical protein [Ekhidna sp.]
MKIGLSFDIDWAPEEMIEDTLNLLKGYPNVNATFFATHKSNALEKAGYEIGIHPNFKPLLMCESNKNFKEIIDELLDIYPESKGFRAHTLTTSTFILEYISQVGLKYESNCLLPYSKRLRIFNYVYGLVKIPFNFEDDVHFGFNYPFELKFLNMEHDDLFIFNFHPIHIYSNNATPEHYSNVKKKYHNPTEVIKHRNFECKGTRDLLIELLEFSSLNQIKIQSLYDLYLSFV